MATYLEKKGHSPRLVLFVHEVSRRGGQERTTLEVFRRLAERGWEIEIYSFSLSDWPDMVPVRWHRIPGGREGIVLFRTLWFFAVSMFLAPRARAKRETVLITIGAASAFADIRIIQFVNHTYLRLVRAGRAPLPNPRTPIHWLYQILFFNLHSTLERFLLPRSQSLIAISDRIRKELIRFIPAIEQKCYVIHHAPETKERNSTGESRRDSGEVSILLVGALERKGIEKCLIYLSGLKDLKWKLNVVGEGDIEKWQGKAIDLGIGTRVDFLGYRVSPPYFRDADIFLFPSTYEPFGLVVSEAVSAGCAVLASNECGAMELWPSRPDWLNLSANDSDERWVTALRKLIVSRDLRKMVSDLAQKDFSSWDWEKATDAYERVFNAL